ncbi:MAG TPA: carbohydrate binding family 9 domain-containing protein [Steroidobacteraceae bacterium]|nr:carbohydrate binding family 9 domain-containing protein [Steroidobacteraceae bacterium]
MRTSLALLCGGLAVLGTALAHAAHARMPSVAIAQARGPVALDGNLRGSVWRTAPSIALTQQNPFPGRPTPFATTVRLLRHGSHLYLGIRCEDPRPSAIAVHTLQRDGDQSNDDNVTVVLDTFAQKKLAYVLQVNAGGGRADGVISPGYVNPNTGSPIDYSWNGYWQAVVHRDPNGWTAEIAIDVRSLQFNGRRSAWGLNVSRYVPRAQLTLVWSGITLNARVTDLQREGSLTGMSGLLQGPGLEFDPYAIVRYDDGEGASTHAGFDVKYALTPQLAALVTYRPDFSDAPTNLLNVTVSPYAQSVPETRPFFLDGTNIFTFSHDLGQHFIPFYSETVGLLDGITVPVDGGVKVLGQADGWTLGMLDMQMGHSEVSAATNLFAARAVYNINDHWRAGTLITHGDPTGATRNTLASFDSTWSTSQFAGNEDLDISAWAAHSSGQAVAGSPDGYGIDIAYPNDLWWMDFSYDDYGEALTPAMGFLQRPGTRQLFADINWQPRPAAGSALAWVRQFDIYGTYTLILDTGGHVQSEDWKLIPLQGTTQSGWSGYLTVNPSYELLQAPYEIVPGVTLPAGRYRFANVDVGVTSPPSRAWWVTLEAEGGPLYDGHYGASYPALNFSAAGGRLNAALQLAFLRFHAPQGSGSVLAQQLKLAYSFDPDLTLQSIVQYDNVTRAVSANTLLEWIIRPNRILHVVWNHGLTLNPNLLQGGHSLSGTSVIVKLQWGFY